MADRPILFNGAMVRAILAGRKTQTRRAIKPQPANDPLLHHPIAPYHNGNGGWNWVLAATGHGTGDPFPCPFGQPGDRLWVRETFMVEAHPADVGLTREQIPRTWDAAISKAGNVLYAADPLSEIAADGRPWRPSIHMPRSACRLVLEVTDVRVERLQSISESDVFSEGLERLEKHDADMRPTGQYRALNQWLGKGEPDIWDRPAEAFRCLWESTGGDWAANPWVWVVGFRIAEGQANG